MACATGRPASATTESNVRLSGGSASSCSRSSASSRMRPAASIPRSTRVCSQLAHEEGAPIGLARDQLRRGLRSARSPSSEASASRVGLVAAKAHRPRRPRAARSSGLNAWRRAQRGQERAARFGLAAIGAHHEHRRHVGRGQQLLEHRRAVRVAPLQIIDERAPAAGRARALPHSSRKARKASLRRSRGSVTASLGSRSRRSRARAAAPGRALPASGIEAGSSACDLEGSEAHRCELSASISGSSALYGSSSRS